MISKKRYVLSLTKIYLFLLIITVLLSFVSCSVQREDGLYEYIFSDADDEFCLREYERYEIVISSEHSARISDAVKRLCRDIENSVGREPYLIYDFEAETIDDTVCRILVGNISVEDCKKFYKGMRSKDFGYLCQENIICVGGLTEESTLSAIAKFTEDVVVYADAEHFADDGKSYLCEGEYPTGEIYLNGFELCEYALIFSDDESGAYLAVHSFRNILSERTGYYLNILSDSDPYAKGRGICIGKTDVNHSDSFSCVSDKAYILPYEKGVSVIYKNNYGLSRSLEKLVLGEYSRICESIEQSGFSRIGISYYRHLWYSATLS